MHAYFKWEEFSFHVCMYVCGQVPIFPGIMPIQSYAGFKRMTDLCKTFVPEHITTALEAIKDDADKVG
jgi:5,10-methylenetetrahydrofolate reductase